MPKGHKIDAADYVDSLKKTIIPDAKVLFEGNGFEIVHVRSVVLRSQLYEWTLDNLQEYLHVYVRYVYGVVCRTTHPYIARNSRKGI